MSIRQVQPLHALTIRQPWAWCIAQGFKAVENRTWRPPASLLHASSELAIHASAAEPAEVELSQAFKVLAAMPQGHRPRPTTASYPWRLSATGTWTALPAATRGAVVAVCRVVGVVGRGMDLQPSQRGWWWGPRGWLLEVVRPLPQPVACRGQQGLWQLPGDVLFQVRDQLG